MSNKRFTDMGLSSATTAIAQWLNSFFEAYDYAILDFLNTLAIGKAGAILTPIMKLISLLGEKGLIFFLLAAGLMIFPKTRRAGVCIFGAVCCGALITSILLKDMVARPRPFEANEVFRSFWDAVGSPAEDGYSFPSGHATAAAAGMTALCWSRGKKFVLPGILWVGLIMISRNYLVAHYPSDVLFGALIGVFSATVAWLITLLIFRILEENDDKAFFHMLLCIGPSFGAKSREERPVQRRSAKRYDDNEEESFRTPKKTAQKIGKDVFFAKSTSRRVHSGEYKGRHEK